MRVLFTDGCMKQSIALRRFTRRGLPSVKITAHDRQSFLRITGAADRFIHGIELADYLARGTFDMVIPVAAHSVRTVAEACPRKAVLPARQNLESSFNKLEMSRLAESLGVPSPRTVQVTGPDDADRLTLPFPCILKGSDEVVSKFAFLVRTRDELRRRLSWAFRTFPFTPRTLPIVQEFIEGSGVGFFALYQDGVACRIFMHQRIREMPTSGGPSCAAKAFDHPTLRSYGLALLDALDWHGVAMVEFRYDRRRDEFYLVEVNPKFWGSAELSLWAGVNWPCDLIRIFQGERLQFSDAYDRRTAFYWPLHGDLEHLIRTRSLGKVGEYLRPHAYTDVRGPPLYVAFEAARTLKALLRRRRDR